MGVLFGLEEKDIVGVFVTGNRQFGLEQIIQTQIFDRNPMVIMADGTLFHQIEPVQARRREMKLDDPAGGLKSLHKTFTGLGIKRFQVDIQFIG